MPTVNIILSVDELNQVLQAMSFRPHNEVHMLISKLQTQAVEQLQPPVAEDAAE